MKSKLQEAVEHDPGFVHTYKDVFDTPQGEIVLLDLERLSRRAVVDSKDVNRDNAVYRCAQEDMLQYIRNKLDK